MTTGRKLAETVHLTTLGLWAGAVAMTGAAAAVLFPTMKKLNPSLPDFAAYPTDQWVIAAGFPASRLFTILDIVQMTCALLVGFTALILLFACRLPIKRASSMLRLLALVALFGSLGYNILVLAPRMNVNLAGFYEQAEAGNVEQADAFRAAFDADHPVATYIMATTLLCALAALLFGLWSYGSIGEGEAIHRVSAERLQEPDLNRPRRG